MADEQKKLEEKVEEIAEGKQQTETPASKVDEITETLNKLRAANDAVEKEMLRKEELRAQVALGGKAEAGQTDKTPEEKTKEEAGRIISMFR